MGIGKQLNRILLDKGLTVAEVARETGINPQTLYAIIKRDNDKVDAEILRDLVIFFNIDIYELLGFEPVEEGFDKSLPATIAAHHDEEDWTEEELNEIEEFKKFVLSKRNNNE